MTLSAFVRPILTIVGLGVGIVPLTLLLGALLSTGRGR